MIELTQGDVLKADVEALVNTVNCVGVMGRGVALQFKNRFPANFKAYKVACDAKVLRPGRMLTFDCQTLDNPRYIINFPTKDHWKGKSRLEYIEAGLEALVSEVRELGVRSLALPPLGCGLGGLNWTDVRPRIEAALAALPDVCVLLYEPEGAPAPASMAHTSLPPHMTLSRAVLIELIQRYLAGLMDTTITLLEIQKLLYFMQESGQPLKLKYEKGTYGPYAKNLRHVLTALEGHYLLGYGDAEDAPTREIALVGDAATQAKRSLQADAGTQKRLSQVADLITGFETPFGMELLATTFWVVQQEGATDATEAVSKVHDWSPRKHAFTERHIRLAYQVLQEKSWTHNQ